MKTRNIYISLVVGLLLTVSVSAQAQSDLFTQRQSQVPSTTADQPNGQPLFNNNFSVGDASNEDGETGSSLGGSSPSSATDENAKVPQGDGVAEAGAGSATGTVSETGTAAGTDTAKAAKNSGPSFAQKFVSSISGAGPMMIPIVGCSILLVMFVLERSIALRRQRVVPKHFTKLFLNELEEGQLKPDEALELCEENKSPISEVFAAAVKKWNRPSVEVEQAVLDAGERVAYGLRRYLRLFNGIATVSPLLGLLGTVLGMITAFNEIASSNAMGRPEMLAKGISQALLTTAGGLSVAIPAFIAYMYFTSRVDRLIIEIDGQGQEVVSAIASDAWKASNKGASRKKAA